MSKRAALRTALLSHARKKIERQSTALKLRELLAEHALGRRDLTATQMRAIQMLLRDSPAQDELPLTHEQRLAFYS